MSFTRFNDQWNNKYKDLSSFAKSIDSQQLEDGIIEGVFHFCKPVSRYCVDIGSADGIWCSNVRNLILQGWSALMIEWDGVSKGEKTFPKLQKNYRENRKVITVHDFVTKENIQETLDIHGVPENLDLLSIDIDSKDLEVWQGIVKHKPNLVVIECNFDRTSLNDFYYVPGDLKGAAGVGSLNQVAQEKGYDYLCVEMCNAFFIKREFGKPLLK